MMTNSTTEDEIRDTATDWLVRMQSDALTAEEWSELTRWLEAAPAHLAAFEAVEALDAEIVAAAPRILAGVQPTTATVIPFRPRQKAVTPVRRYGGAIAAGLAAVTVALGYGGWRASEGQLAVYAAGPDAPRLVVLADGSRIRLDANSRLSVRLGWFGRRATLDNAVASFDIAKDPKRPFVITADDERVRVVGTEFVVRNYGGIVDVTVRRGVVAVSPAGAGAVETRLTPGWSLRHVVKTDQTVTRRVDPSGAFAFAQGRIVCDHESLGEVVAYLNHRYATPVRLASPAAANETFSGVLDVSGDEESVVRRLASYVSLTAHRSSAEIVLD